MADETGLFYFKKQLPIHTTKDNKTWGDVLDDAVANGQHPELLIIHQGSFSPSLMTIAPTEAFVSAKVNDAAIIASANYAQHHLESSRVLYYVSDNDLKKLKDAPPEERREAALDLIRNNMKTLEGNFEGPVMCCYQTKDGIELFSGEEIDSGIKNHEILKGDFGFVEKPAEIMFCSCCDSRAEAGHLCCTEPGEVDNKETIAALVTDEQIKEAKEAGVKRATVIEHSKCGGVHGLTTAIIESMETGTPVELGNLAGWLLPAEKEARTAIEFAQKKLGGLRDEKGQINSKIFTMVELWLAQKSGERLIEAFGEDNVKVQYYDIRKESRALYALDPHATLEQTFANAMDLSRLKLISSPTSEQAAPKVPELSEEVKKNRALLAIKIEEGFKIKSRNNHNLGSHKNHTPH